MFGDPQHACGLGRHGFDVGEPGDIGLDEMGAAAGLAGVVRDRFGARLVVEPGERHVGARLGQCPADGRSYALLRAGHQRHLACEFHAKSPIPRPNVPFPGQIGCACVAPGPPL